MFCVTMVTLANISITAELFYVAAVLVITVVCPAWFIRLQTLRKYVCMQIYFIVNPSTNGALLLVVSVLFCSSAIFMVLGMKLLPQCKKVVLCSLLCHCAMSDIHHFHQICL